VPMFPSFLAAAEAAHRVAAAYGLPADMFYTCSLSGGWRPVVYCADNAAIVAALGDAVTWSTVDDKRYARAVVDGVEFTGKAE